MNTETSVQFAEIRTAVVEAAKVFRNNALAAESPQLVALCREIAEEYENFVVELEATRQAPGSEAESSSKGVPTGEWLDLTAAFEHSDDAVVLARGETAIGRASEVHARVLHLNSFPAEIAQLVEAQSKAIARQSLRWSHVALLPGQENLLAGI